MTTLEQIEHRALVELGDRLARVTDVTPSVAILCVEAHLRAARVADLEDADPWMAVATIALKQAVVARQNAERQS